MIGSEKLNEKQMILIGVLAVIFVAFLVVVNLLDNKSLNGIKAKKVGNGQHGTARWATKTEIKRTLSLCHSSLNSGGRVRICRLYKAQLLVAEVQGRKP